MKNFFLTIAIAILFSNLLSAQVSSRNGYAHTGHDTIRVFLVFAEIVGDPLYDELVSSQWAAGALPLNASDYFESEIDGVIESYITKYYHEASFGDFVILGDYYPEIVGINKDNVVSSNGSAEVFDYLNNLPGTDFETAGSPYITVLVNKK